MKKITVKLTEAISEELSKYYFNISEDYPPSFDKEVFYGLRSFAERIRYCSQHLEKIAAGTGRVVFKVDDKTALKLAKNPKGIAQNAQEAQLGADNYISDIVANVFNSDNDDKWIESELATKVKPNRFKELVGVDIDTAGKYLMQREKEEERRSRSMSGYNFMDTKSELYTQLHENEFLQRVVELMFNYNIKAGDFSKLNSYGEVNREGHPTIVVVDYGLSDEVYQTHYMPKSLRRGY